MEVGLRHSDLKKPEAVLAKRLGKLRSRLASWVFLSNLMTTQSGSLKAYLLHRVHTQKTVDVEKSQIVSPVLLTIVTII